MKRRISFFLLLAGLVAGVVILTSRKPAVIASVSGKTVIHERGNAGSSRGEQLASFRAWSAKHRSAKISPQDLEKGVRIATERKAVMLDLIATNPALALQNAVSWSEYQALPGELKPFVEQPFNAIGSLRVLPVCDSHESHEDVRVLEISGKSWNAAVFGQRLAQGTKEGTPLAGITLDGQAAVREYSLETLTTADSETLAVLPLGNPDATRDFSTGEPLGASPVTAIAGGKRYLFNNAATVAEMNERLATFDQTPGPHGGARLVFEMADGGAGAEGISWSEAADLVQVYASSWTETPKSVFFIRVDFSDQAGEAVSQATLSDVLNNATASSISEMSYGKTTITAAVSATTVRMPSPKTTYLPGNNDALYNDAVAAYKVIAGANSLNGYDIVGVHFPSIGISSGGVTYSGLAGGSRQWLQGTSNSGVIIHEFGHNYGIGHSSFWDTSDGSVVGSGGSVEYGDPFDIMGSGPDPEGHFHMQAKQYLNWLGSTQWADATATGSGTYRIHRFDNPFTTGTLRGLRVTKAASPGEYYWLGYRPGIPGNSWLANGAYLVWQRPNFSRSWLLDTTVNSPGGTADSAIALGATYTDAAAGVNLTPVAKGGSGANAWLDVNVQLGNFPGNQPPTATLNAPANAAARASATVSVSATDPNGDALAYAWDFGDSSPSANSPSIDHTWSVGGTYTVKVTITDMKGGVVTKTGSVTVSDPLNTWTQRTSATTATLNDITYGGGKLVAVGESKGTYRVSTDGLSWTGGTIWVSGNTGNNLYLEGVIHDGTQFVCVGYDYNFSAPEGWTGAIYTSPNGTSWTRRHFLGPELRDIAFDGENYVAVGDGGTIWQSTNALTWSPRPSGVTLTINGVSSGNGGFVAVGYDPNTAGSGFVLTSPDGVTWTNRSAGAGLLSWHGFYDVQFCNNRFLASGWYSKIRHSTDGGVTFASTESATRQIPAFSYGNGIYLAAGIDKDNADADINLISTDGANWTPLTTASQENRNAAVFFNNTFITVGDGGKIWQSSTFTAPVANNYASWVAANFPGSPALSGAADDFDGDGVPNLGEYATGSDPRDHGDHADLSAVIVADHFTMTLPKADGVTDVGILVESSTDLKSWSNAGTTVVEDSASQLVVRITATVSSAVPPQRFLRARFLQGP